MPAPLRFRVWHDGQMHGPDGIAIENGIALKTSPFATVWSLRGGVVMQSTGLTDADGREIFEGDVVELTMSSVTARHLVDFSRGAFWLGAFTLSEGIGEGVGRVVGNVHENPHLRP